MIGRRPYVPPSVCVFGFLTVALPSSAFAGPPTPTCASLPGTKVYMMVGDTQQPLMKTLGRRLRDDPNPTTLVYVTSGSCSNIDAIRNATPITTNLLYVPSTAENPAWSPAMPALPCTPPPGGVVPQVVNSAVFVSACTTEPLATDIGSYHGPVQAYVMAVPEASNQTVMTFEEAYFVFGFGTAGMVMPWLDEMQLFIRTITKSTLLAWAANIGVPAVKWKGVAFDSSTQVVNALLTATNPEAAVGILGAEIYDSRRDVLDILAFRAKDQFYAYYPDSTAISFDKLNVRDGHYTVWSPTIYLTKVSGGVPINPAAGRIIDLILGHTVTPPPAVPSLDSVIDVGLVPECAMKVTRSFEGGPLSLHRPTEPCGCYFESKLATTACTACNTNTPCSAGTCRNGYCEER